VADIIQDATGIATAGTAFPLTDENNIETILKLFTRLFVLSADFEEQ